MNRRDFLALAGTAGMFPRMALAQQTQARIPRIAFLGTPRPPAQMDAFYAGLADFGYVNGKNITVDLFTPPNVADVASAAAQAVASQPDLIVTVSSPAPIAAKALTTTIPIVFTALNDPIGIGLIDNLARPGGNLTGNYSMANELIGKRLEMLRELNPRLSRVAVLAQMSDPITAATLVEFDKAILALGLTSIVMEIEEGILFETPFAGAAGKGAEALYFIETNFMTVQAPALTALALKYRLPTMGQTRAVPDAAGLMSYGVTPAVIIRRVGYYIDRVLKGSKPGELAVERPTQFECVVNLKTAQALGIVVPNTILTVASEVIQ